MSSRWKKLLRLGIGLGILAFVGIQFVPVKHIGVNPPERFQIDAPPPVQAIMRRACFDCHTNETRWPLYARIAPSSWLMSRDVHNGREHLNFSEWGDASEDTRRTDRENAWEQVEAGNMPPWFYVYPMHLDARLSDADKALLKSYFMKDAGKPRDSDKAKEVENTAEKSAEKTSKDGEKPAAKP